MRGAALAAALLMLFLGAGLWNATRATRLVEARLPLAGLPAGTEIRVLLMGDTHFGFPDMGTGRLLGIVAQANAQKPDLIVLTGDYMGGKIMDWPRARLEQALPPLAALKAPLGAWAVMGNHDVPVWTPQIAALQVQPKMLINAHADVGPLVVVGLDSAKHGADPARALAGVPPGKPIIMLLHEGDHLAGLTPPPFNPVLVLSGHTHGGQVILPGIGSVGSLFLGKPLCNRGACRVNGWPLFVTSGVGTSWLPIRYGVPPEIVLLTLHAP
ncbi:MAG: metallophosphoesterase [Sandarakinorhabdus sp.]|nr:metallophosphoesterase [Sandarakinorhabdus sp.]